MVRRGPPRPPLQDLMYNECHDGGDGSPTRQMTTSPKSKNSNDEKSRDRRRKESSENGTTAWSQGELHLHVSHLIGIEFLYGKSLIKPAQCLDRVGSGVQLDISDALPRDTKIEPGQVVLPEESGTGILLDP